jgi:hypothetical protein
MAKKQPQISKQTFNAVSQSAHFFGACTFVFGWLACFPSKRLFLGILIFTVAAAVKEFWYDYRYENRYVRGSSLLDFTMYVVGLGTSYGVWRLMNKVIS